VTTAVAPRILVDAVLRRMSNASTSINAYWICAAGDRDAYALALERELALEPVAVIVIRDTRFTNPNALLSDFVELIAENRELCESRFADGCARCAFILVSRTELMIPQISSPVLLPEWFPLGGGTTLEMHIVDVSWTADASLSTDEVRADALSERLLSLEHVLIGRFAEVLEADPDRRRTMALFDVLRRDGDSTLEALLEEARQHAAGVTTPTAFRPSVRDGRSLIARIWGVVQARSPENMKTPSEALAVALDLPESLPLAWHEPLESVLRRPSGGEPSERLRFARSAFVAIGASCQLVTASAHADAYGHYPIAFLRTMSYDLFQALDGAETLISVLDPIRH
jgi:hypothetical protein